MVPFNVGAEQEHEGIHQPALPDQAGSQPGDQAHSQSALAPGYCQLKANEQQRLPICGTLRTPRLEPSRSSGQVSMAQAMWARGSQFTYTTYKYIMALLLLILRIHFHVEKKEDNALKMLNIDYSF